jgi:hypothetical protein
MLASFRLHGFDVPETEFLYVDNSEGNKYDGFQALNRFLSLARGRCLIVCHQDVRLLADGCEALSTRIGEMARLDPNWAVLGNAGGASLEKVVLRITDPWIEDARIGNFPERVASVDENFVVIRASANLAVSRDLSGFHLYATDLCLMADVLGYSCYVIDFHLHHLGGGSQREFVPGRQSLIDKYSRALRPRFVRTTCTRMYLSGSKLGSWLLNQSWAYKLARTWIRRRDGRWEADY